MKILIKIFLLLIYIIFSLNTYAANFLYITDKVEIPIREENKIGNNILLTLPSGTKLSILESTDSWTKIKYNEIVGWIMTRYLDAQPNAKDQLEAIKKENNINKLELIKLKSNKQELESDLKNIAKEKEQLQIQNAKIIAEKKHIENIYQNSLEIEHKNSELKKEVLQLEEELKISKNNNQIENDRVSRNWFITGALVLILGMFIGFLFQTKFNKKRY